MKLIKVPLLLLATIASLTHLLPASANLINPDSGNSQIPVQIREINSSPQPNINPNPQPNISQNNDTQIKIFDPLNPSQNNSQPNVPEPQVDRKPLTGRMIPAASAIVVTVPSDLQLDAGGTTSITLVLTRAIFDNNGDEIAPVNSLVSARLQPDKGGVNIIADSLILRGKHIRIRASSAMFRGETTIVNSGISKSDSFGNIGEILLKPFGDVSLIGRGVGTLVGLFSPEHQTTVRIPQGTVFVLSLQSALTLQ